MVRPVFGYGDLWCAGVRATGGYSDDGSSVTLHLGVPKAAFFLDGESAKEPPPNDYVADAIPLDPYPWGGPTRQWQFEIPPGATYDDLGDREGIEYGSVWWRFDSDPSYVTGSGVFRILVEEPSEYADWEGSLVWPRNNALPYFIRALVPHSTGGTVTITLTVWQEPWKPGQEPWDTGQVEDEYPPVAVKLSASKRLVERGSVVRLRATATPPESLIELTLLRNGTTFRTTVLAEKVFKIRIRKTSRFRLSAEFTGDRVHDSTPVKVRVRS